MKVRSLILLANILAATSFVSAVDSPGLAAPGKGAAPAAKTKTAADFPKVMTGMDTNISIQLLKVIRANVDEFGRNNIVVVQFRLRKEGPSPSGLKSKSWLNPTDIKLRDSALGSSYEVITGAGHQHSTRSDTIMTNDWTVGQTGDGYVWLKIPDDVKTVDIFFPYTKGFMQVPIEIPK